MSPAGSGTPNRDVGIMHRPGEAHLTHLELVHGEVLAEAIARASREGDEAVGRLVRLGREPLGIELLGVWPHRRIVVRPPDPAWTEAQGGPKREGTA